MALYPNHYWSSEAEKIYYTLRGLQAFKLSKMCITGCNLYKPENNLLLGGILLNLCTLLYKAQISLDRSVHTETVCMWNQHLKLVFILKDQLLIEFCYNENCVYSQHKVPVIFLKGSNFIKQINFVLQIYFGVTQMKASSEVKYLSKDKPTLMYYNST